ncbi:UDP-glucosyltransferase 2 [Drosophila ficusphila]|uniref:UDP-glucosyltransferase 2 n=1 Tax=Drosophila ficusphila TaxID=30025 RepID=UPI0007E71A81|nr:UDP-glucosyltransferase 2 [Drosophila ficusphila]
MLALRSVFLWVVAAVSCCHGANILGLYSALSPSHLIIHMSTAKALAEAGHNVTVVTRLKPKVMHDKIHLIVVPPTREHELAVKNAASDTAGSRNSRLSTKFDLLTRTRVLIDSQADLISDPRFQRVYETKFDLMILGSYFNDFQLGVAAKMKIPVIVNWMMPSSALIDRFVGNPSEISYVPNELTYATARMSFLKRAENALKQLILMYSVVAFDHKFNRIYNEIFPEKDLPTLEELRKNISMVFVGSHLISDGPIRPQVPAIVEIGGIQVKDQPDPLPEDIDQFLNNSTQGAILISFGSCIKSSILKPEIIQAIFKVVSNLKQNVIWKWEDLGNLPGNATNILFKNWLPQDDILSHPNTKLFITHAGKGGVTEAQYHGVPMVAFPIFGDQPINAASMAGLGHGLALDLLTTTEDSLRKAVKEVLENRKYSQAVRKFSSLYRDRPLTPRQSVVFWTEYVLRHHGAPHLQSPAVHLSFIELNNLDVYASFVAILVLFCLVIRQVWKFLYSKLLLGQVEMLKAKKKQ